MLFEHWRACPGLPGYEISDYGRLRSWLRRANDREQPLAPRLVKGSCDKDGYRRATLKVAGQRRYVRYHYLVLEVFVGPRPFSKAVTRHLDGDVTNNALVNLCWGTQKENIADRDRQGNHPTQKLFAAERAAIKASTETLFVLAQRYGVTRHTVWRAKHDYVPPLRRTKDLGTLITP